MLAQISLAGGLACTTMGADVPTPDDCWGMYVQNKHNCASEYNSDKRPDYQNQQAYITCLAGAEIVYDACCDGENSADAVHAWIQFLFDRLSFCIDDNRNDPAGLESCLRVALAELQDALDDLLNPDGNGCGPAAAGVRQMAPIYTLQQAAIRAGRTDGRFPAAVNSTVTFTAGVNPNGAAPYDISQQPCMKNAVSVALFATRDGPKVIVYDGDTDTSDGVSFSLPLFQSSLIDTYEVHIVNVYFDQQSMPRFAELGTLTIEPSPLKGDWNRDNVTNTQDLIDFLGSYSSQTIRSDLNGDGVTDEHDACIFIQEYTE